MAGTIPSPYQIDTGAPQVGRLIEATPDTSGLTRGVDSLANAAGNIANDAVTMADFQKKQDNTLDIAKAESIKTQGFLDMGKAFKHDPDYATFGERAAAQSNDVMATAANVIRDPNLRATWQAQSEVDRIRAVSSIADSGDTLRTAVQKSALEETLDRNQNIVTDPTVDPKTRNDTLVGMASTLKAAEQTGLISPADAYEWNKKYMIGTDKALASNTAQLAIANGGAHDLVTQLGIPTTPAGNELTAAQASAAGGVVPLDPAIAAQVAPRLGDTAFPQDPKMQAAYLSDPTINAKYLAQATQMMTDRYHGDLTAAVIANAPGGGTKLADQWVASGHNEKVLPAGVANYYDSVMKTFAPQTGAVNFPIQAQNVDLSTISPPVLDRFQKLQSVFGKQLTVIPGYVPANEGAAPIGGATTSTPAAGVQGLDVDVSQLSPADKSRLIQTASAMGFGGVGVYGDSMHLDAGAARAWGPNGQPDSVPAEHQDAVDQHTSPGGVTNIPPNLQAANPAYASLNFDERLKLYQEAQHKIEQDNMIGRASLNVAVENAPLAISSSGSYTGNMPTANDFVKAYGGVEGVDRWTDFNAQIQSAHTAFGMRTMSNSDILKTVQAAAPTGFGVSGDEAHAQWTAFDNTQKAADAILQERQKDPAAYVSQAFPAVGQAWAGVDPKDPSTLSNAIMMTAQAQTKLGIDLQLLPDQMAKNAAAAFKNVNLPTDQRIGAITSLALVPKDPAQQQAIFDQLTKAGVPEFAQGAMAALERGDTNAASNLFRAVMVDPTKLPGVIADKTNQIRQTIQDRLFGDNGLATTAYRLTGGTADNYQQAARDGELLTRGVQLRLMDGTATNLNDAVDKAGRDLFGDKKVFTSEGGYAPYGNTQQAGAKVAVDSSVDNVQLQTGFNALLSKVGPAVAAEFHNANYMASDHSMEARDDAAASGARGVSTWIGDNYVRSVLNNGYFANHGENGFTFINSQTNTAVKGEDGNPMTFSLDDVRAAAALASASQRQAAAQSGNALHGR